MSTILKLRDVFHGFDPSVDLFVEICKVVDEDPAPEVVLYAQDHLNTWKDQGMRVSRVWEHKPSQSLIRVLLLWGCRIGPSGAAALATSPNIKNLAHLNLQWNEIGSQGAAALAASPYLTNLTTLNLGDNRIGDEGVSALAASPHLKNLTTLGLDNNSIGDMGAAALAASPNLKDAKVIF